MVTTPPGFTDLDDDAERAPDGGPYHDLNVPGIGIVKVRRPMPKSAAALAMAANSKINNLAKLDHLGRFAINHLAPGEMERLIVAQMNQTIPADAFQVIARSIATWGTARPTRRSSRSA